MVWLQHRGYMIMYINLLTRGISMFRMFTQFFAMLSSYFSAAEKLGSAANHLATWADESAGAFADQAREERGMKLAALRAKAVPTLPAE